MDVSTDNERGEAGRFGRPLFEDASARALSRVGVVDVGSNSVRLVIFDGATRSPAYYYNEKIMCALGADLNKTGRLNPKGRKRALAAIKRFQLLAAGMGLAPLAAVATAAVREARDGNDFCAQVRRETGLQLRVIDAMDEARLAAQGVLLGWPGARGLVCDMGGASMELAEVSDGKVGARATSPLGPLKLQALEGGPTHLRAHIRVEVERLADEIGPGHKRLFLVGGSWRAIARLDMERRKYPLHVLHEYRMTPDGLRTTLKWIAASDKKKLRARTGISKGRMALVPVAATVLDQMIRTFKPAGIAMSGYGLREGLLFEQMPEQIRRRDPLIEACRFAEARDGRRPGFGAVLDQFIAPIFESESPATRRLISAACLLHDVTWRAHPDLRAEVCFDNATRANLGGLNHHERIWLGLALMHRYKKNRDATKFSHLIELLDETDALSAEIVGRAMRFGSMFSGAAPGDVATLKWRPKKAQLSLSLSSQGADLYGEVAAARFKSLAKALGAEAAVKVTKP